MRDVTRYSHDPSWAHWKSVQEMMTYLDGTRDFALTYRKGARLDLTACADSLFARDDTDRRFVSKRIVVCVLGAVAWLSRTQRCVTLSTSEADYVAIGYCVKEAPFVRGVLMFLLPLIGEQCIRVLKDNERPKNLQKIFLARPVRDTLMCASTSSKSCL